MWRNIHSRILPHLGPGPGAELHRSAPFFLALVSILNRSLTNFSAYRHCRQVAYLNYPSQFAGHVEIRPFALAVSTLRKPARRDSHTMSHLGTGRGFAAAFR